MWLIILLNVYICVYKERREGVCWGNWGWSVYNYDFCYYMKEDFIEILIIYFF